MSHSDAAVRKCCSATLQRAMVYTSTILSLAVVLPVRAESIAELVPRCSGAFNLCGYIDKASKEERIAQQFEVAQPFSDGLAAVRVKGLYGFINTSGKYVIPPRFQNAGPFAGEYAEVRLDGATGIVNRSGRVVVTPQFRRIIPFVGDTFIAKPFVIVEGYPREVLRNDERLEGMAAPLALSSYNDSGIYHLKKGWLTEQNVKFSFFDKPDRGLIWASPRNNAGTRWGLMRSDGSWQVKLNYDQVFELRGEIAVVESKGFWGAVDNEGKLTVPLEFRSARAVWDEDKRAMNRKPVKADASPDEPQASEQADAHRLLVACPGGLTIIQRGDGIEFRKSKDGPLIGTFNKGYFQASDCQKGIAATRNGKWFVVLEDGFVLGGANGYENLSASLGKHRGAKVGGKWGIIDKSGVFLVEPRFESLRLTPDDTYAVSEGGETYWINASGDRVTKPTKEWGGPMKRSLACGGGLRFFQQGELWGLQDSDGKAVIEPKYPALSCFRQGVAWVAATNATEWCPVGSDGKRIEAMACKQEYFPQTWSHSRPEYLATGTYENSIAWNRAWLDYHAGKRDAPPKWVNMGYGYVRDSPISK